jgi:hypothetical protein
LHGPVVGEVKEEAHENLAPADTARAAASHLDADVEAALQHHAFLLARQGSANRLRCSNGTMHPHAVSQPRECRYLV